MDWMPVILSLKIAGLSLGIVLLVGIPIAFLMARRDFIGKSIVESLLTLPLVMPPVVTGFILLYLIGRRGLIGTFLYEQFGIQLIFTSGAAVLAAATVAFPLMYQSAKAAFLSVDRKMEEVARTLNANEIKIFVTVTLPAAFPGIISGVVLAFARALGEFGATAMIAGNIPGKTQTIPIAIFFAAESNEIAKAGLYALIISLVTFGLIYGVNHWLKQQT